MLGSKIETLLAVAEFQNFTKAAASLSLTQPAVSHHINQLEEELGVTLFIRGKGSLMLTPEGEIVLKYARRIKALYGKMETEIDNSRKQLTKVRIGITHTSESNLITEVLARCSNADNNFSITIITDTINNLYDMLDNLRDRSGCCGRNANRAFPLFPDVSYRLSGVCYVHPASSGQTCHGHFIRINRNG